MNCPSCQVRVSARDRFCRRCGEPLKAGGELREALARMHRGDYEGAAALLRAELAKQPEAGRPRLLTWLGHALFLAGRQEEAARHYGEALVSGRAPWDTHYQLAVLAFSRGDHGRAAEGFEACLRLAPDALSGHPLAALFGGKRQALLASCRLYLGLCRKELGDFAAAEQELKASIELDPSNALPHGVLGDLRMAAGRYQEAAEAYQGALQAVKDEAGLLALRNDLGVAYFRAGRLEEAAEEFKRVIQSDPGNANALHNLGVLYLRQGLSDEMRADLREFLKAEHAETILMGLTRSMVEAAGGGLQPNWIEAERVGMLGRSRRMQEVLELVQRAARSDATVLLLGENGTGKELAARAIHALGPRRDKPFVAVNCGALPEALLESELFGYEKGAFTGATASKPGRFELADGGTLFLDEIGDLKLSLQVKLLRAIQERSFERLGGTRTLRADLRFIAATNSDLRRKVLRGEFREDLFYRLFVIPITLPPLRERRDDIPLLAQHFLERAAARSGRRFRRISPEALAKLSAYPWPGNVRELENVVERAVALHDGEALLPDHLHFESLETSRGGPSEEPAAGGILERAEREAILQQLRASGFRVTAAAKSLGLSRATLYRKMQKFQISIPSDLSH